MTAIMPMRTFGTDNYSRPVFLADRMPFPAWLAACCWLIAVLQVPAIAVGQQLADGGSLPTTVGPGALPPLTSIMDFRSLAITTPDPAGQAVNIAEVIGALRFYDANIVGQNTNAWVVDAGLAWSGHDALTNLSVTTHSSDAVSTPDGHATACAMLVGGRPGGPLYWYQLGIAPFTTLGSAAIATQLDGDGSFQTSGTSVSHGFRQAAQWGDVVSASIGVTPDPAGLDTMTGLVDSLAVTNRWTTFVAAAGNSGTAATPAGRYLGGPASGYNSIAVGALGNPTAYNGLADFSSRGPLPTAWWDGTTVYQAAGPDARAGVDIVAPGVDIVSAAYAIDPATGQYAPYYYYVGLAGTSFATPLVAGGATLLVSAARSMTEFVGVSDAARTNVVIKSVLLNSATKPSTWNNGQRLVDGVITTTQGLDYDYGAGSLDLNRGYEQYVTGNRDVVGLVSGSSAAVMPVGWDLGTITLGHATSYSFTVSDPLEMTLNATLSWNRSRTWDQTLDGGNGEYRDLAQADLDLSVWDITTSGTSTLIARSTSLVNTTEHLSFTLPALGLYEIRVNYGQNLFDLSPAGSSYASQEYGLAWAVVPEPSAAVLAAAGIAGLWLCRRRVRAARAGHRSEA